jgi:hypothetical protein
VIYWPCKPLLIKVKLSISHEYDFSADAEDYHLLTRGLPMAKATTMRFNTIGNSRWSFTPRNIRLIYGYVLLAAMQFFFVQPAFAEATFAPILPLNFPKPTVIPLLEESLRDPIIFKKKIKEDSQVSDLVKANKELKLKLKTAKAKSQVKYAVELMENHAAIAYYYADRLSGRFGGGPAKKYNALMVSSYKNLIEHANVVQSLSKSPIEVAIATYHIAAATYVIDDSAQKSPANLKPLTAKGSVLPDRLLKRSLFILAITDLASGDAKAADALEPLLNEVGTSGGISAKLALARFTAGINGQGDKTGTTNDAYLKLLFAASDKAFTVGKRNQEKIFGFILGVWRTSAGPKGTWKKAPFNEERFTDYPELVAIQERDGLWEWFSGNKRSAIATYSQLALTLKTESTATDLDRRTLDMEELLFQESRVIAPYEKSLVDLRKRYSSEKLLGRDLGKRESGFSALIEKKHRMLVDTLLLGAASIKVTEANRVDAIGVANRYLVLIKDKPNAESESIETKIAGLWVLNKNYPKAVELYVKLATEAKPEKKQIFYEQAIKSQTIVANWPESPPWEAVPAGDASARKKLLGIFISLNDLRKAKIDWIVVSHIGQLHLNLNQPAAAFKLWDDAIHKSPQHPAAALAAGTMLTSFLKTQSWEELEELARFTLFARVQPLFNKAPLSPAVLLPFALVKGGDAAFKAGKFAVAVKKFKELSTKFVSKDSDYNYFMLAGSYRGDKKYKDSIETLVDFTEKFTKSTYLRQVLINGGTWSVPLAYEENAMYFYKEFLKHFPTDAEAQRTADSLVGLYLGRRLYVEAATVLRERTLSTVISPEAKLTANVQLMRLEYKYGSKDRAYQAADTILLSSTTGDIRAATLVIKAHRLYTSRNVPELLQIEAQIKTLGSSPTAIDGIGEVRYLLAEAKLGPMFASVNSHSVQNPIQAVFDRYALFTKSQADYLYVCSSGQPSMCGPALHRVARFADRMILLINDFQIPATLEEKVINDFMKRKNGLIANLRKTAEDMDKRAASIIVSGHTDPEWTNQILWKNLSDWNFEPVSGNSGSGFIQWNFKKES